MWTSLYDLPGNAHTYAVFLPLGEYIDINFDQKKEPSPKSVRSGSGTWVRTSSTSTGPSAATSAAPGSFGTPIVREHEYAEVGAGVSDDDGEHYAMMSPTGSKDIAPKLSTSLHKVTCPLSLDDPSVYTLPPPSESGVPSPGVGLAQPTSELVASLLFDSNAKTPSSGGVSPHSQRQQSTVVPSYGHSSPISPAATSGGGEDGNDSDYFNLDFSAVSGSGATAMGKKAKDSTSPSKVGSSSGSGSASTTTTKMKVTSKVDQSSAGGGSSRKHSSSPLASLLHGLSHQGLKSPKHKGGSSPKHSVSDDTSAYSEMSFLPPSPSPKVNRRRSDSSSPSSSPSQFTKTPPHSIVAVKPSAVHTTATGASANVPKTCASTGAPHRAVSGQGSNSNNASNSNTAAMRSIKSTGSLSTMDVSNVSKIHVTSPKILLTSTELINELSAGNTANSASRDATTLRLSQDMSSATYENMSFENNRPLRQSSYTSISSSGVEPELHYAALDLSASAEDIMPMMAGFEHPSLQKSPANKSRHTSGGVGPGATNGSGGVGGVTGDEDMPLQYAQIDFIKSESLKATLTGAAGGNGNSANSASGNTTVKETQMPFDVANMALPLQAALTPPTPSDSNSGTSSAS